jgi:hypothetical protein
MMYWLSFADSELPKGSQFLGCAIVEANDIANAIARSHVVGCNPGGQVLCAEITEDRHAEYRRYVNRLMQRDEIERALGPVLNPSEFTAAHPDVKLTGVCPACNGKAGEHTHS